jgi:menaquinone-9 beta-reductase
MTKQPTYDVAVVGASIAGCSAAILYARAGLKVALIERHSDIDAYKQICTHFIQSSATPTIERLGLHGPLERAGAVKNAIDIFSDWGWIRVPGAPHGYNARRQVIDPMVRWMAANTPGVDLLLGHSVRELIQAGGRTVGVKATTDDGKTVDVASTLVVGADGRNSRIAKLSNVKQRVRENTRFLYFAHFEDLPLASGRTSQLWMFGRTIAHGFPNDAGITVLACSPNKSELPAFKADLDGAFASYFAGLPNAPDPRDGRRVGQVLGMIEAPNVSNDPVAPGIALIGDAATSSDPAWGVGCGWAFQSAEWLVDSTAPQLADGDPAAMDLALAEYRKKHASRIGVHHKLIADFSTGRPLNAIERLTFSAAARNARAARRFESFASRREGVQAIVNPAAIAHSLWVNAHAMLGS